MAYFLDLFSPETYAAFGRSDQTVSGFRLRQRNMAARVKRGDHLLCYMTRLSRWFGVLEVLEGPFQDATPIFHPENDPFVIRFRVKPLIWLPVVQAIPIHDAALWTRLSFTKEHSQATSSWTGKLRASLAPIDDADGSLIEKLLRKQVKEGRNYPLDASDERKMATHTVRRADKDVVVTVPVDADEEKPAPSETRESIQVQALLAEIGVRMGMKIWIPRSDRNGVLAEWNGGDSEVLDRLPLNYDDTTLKTIEQIDVLWLKGRSIRRAFEVEHTTSIYSGLLRMADLLALQPNMDIRLHIVAPAIRRAKVLQELRRPVFSLLERGPLSETCTYLAYDALRELARQPNLSHLKETVLDDYEESAEED
jgi:predicted RNA-binding protein